MVSQLGKYVLGMSVLVLAGCDLPKDPDGTLDRVREGTLRAGLIAGEPYQEQDWNRLTRLAARLNARLEIVVGGAHGLVRRLEKGELDLVASLPKDTPFKSPGFTHPVGPPPFEGAMPPVWAVPAGENAWLQELNRFLEAEEPRR